MLPEGFTPDFVESLRLIGSAMEELRAANRQCPILVGGAALQLWTTGRYVSGDFDLVGVIPTRIKVDSAVCPPPSWLAKVCHPQLHARSKESRRCRPSSAQRCHGSRWVNLFAGWYESSTFGTVRGRDCALQRSSRRNRALGFSRPRRGVPPTAGLSRQTSAAAGICMRVMTPAKVS